MTLSVCMIVKDEEEVLGRCLMSIQGIWDELIVVDTGSKDNTKEIAGAFGATVYDFAWCDHFAKARNFSFSKAREELVMWLDADDVLTEEDCKKVQTLKSVMRDYDMAFAEYDAGGCRYVRERIFRRECGFVWQGAVHEVIVPRGRIYHSDLTITHKKGKKGDSMRNLSIFQKQIASGEKLDERERFYYGRELSYHNMETEAIAVLKEFLRGDGWGENKAEACLVLFRLYQKRGEEAEAKECLVRSFLYAKPKAEVCCLLGDCFLQSNLSLAIDWYLRALDLDSADELRRGGFVQEDYLEFIPCMQLCYAYDRLGEYALAERYNERAGRCKPQDERYLYNKRYFESRSRG